MSNVAMRWFPDCVQFSSLDTPQTATVVFEHDGTCTVRAWSTAQHGSMVKELMWQEHFESKGEAMAQAAGVVSQPWS